MEITPSLHRSRLLMYAQLSDDFLIVSNLGMNGLTPGQLDPLGYNSQRHLFLHDAWIEFKVTRWLYIGSGLHYWNGISRLTNQSTLNFCRLTIRGLPGLRSVPPINLHVTSECMPRERSVNWIIALPGTKQ